MVKAKTSMTAAQRAALKHVNDYISETQPKVDSIIAGVKEWLWAEYGEPDYVSVEIKEQIRAALDDYEPSVTEGVISEIVYGESNLGYGEIIQGLESYLEGSEWRDADDFYITWSALQRMTEERKQLIAGQMTMRM